MELSETKIKGLVRLVKRGRIEVEDISDEDYKEEVENRLESEEYA